MTDFLRQAPFALDDEGVAWVQAQISALSPRDKAAQLFTLLSMGQDPGELARLAAFKPAGITRFFSRDAAYEAGFLDAAQAGADIPLLVSADLEGSRMSLAFGTEVPNPLALAAIDDLAATRDIAAIMAREARAMGINWSFTPVLDINAAFRSPIVATRGFGSDPARIARHALAQIEVFQAHGLAATAKHWPGEGHDDRDQHLVTTRIPLTVPEWQATHGALYRQAIDAGVMAVMAAHIAFPAYVRQHDPAATVEAYRPASASAVLTQGLLRETMGFNGVIVSDATPMAGLGAFGPRDRVLPEVIAAGCDMILFTEDADRDLSYIMAAIDDGRITPDRLDQALARVLGLKAALGLHRPQGRAADRLGQIGLPADRATARAITARAPVLVKDVQGILPLSPARTPRVQVVSGGVISPLHPAPFPFDVPDLLRAEGFEVSLHQPGAPLAPPGTDLVLFLFGEETLLTRGRIFLDWLRLIGNFHAAMDRPWHRVPTAMVSFGYPYMLYDAPRMPCVVNAFATMPSMQAAVVDCLMGRAAWNTDSPVDAFCGLEDAQW